MPNLESEKNIVNYTGEVTCMKCMSSSSDDGKKDMVIAYKGEEYHAWCKCCDFSIKGESFEDIDSTNLFNLD